MICFCCGREIKKIQRKAGSNSQNKTLERVEKIFTKVKDSKVFWEKIEKIISLNDCSHSLKSIISSDEHVTKGKSM